MVHIVVAYQLVFVSRQTKGMRVESFLCGGFKWCYNLTFLCIETTQDRPLSVWRFINLDVKLTLAFPVFWHPLF